MEFITYIKLFILLCFILLSLLELTDFFLTKILFFIHSKIKNKELRSIIFSKNYYLILTSLIKLRRIFFYKINSHFIFLPLYYSRNDLIWADGFLFDFLQKKSTDVWLRKFIIYTGYIFSERMVFDHVVRIYLENIIWPLHFVGIMEVENVIEMFSILLFLYFFLFSLCFLFFLFF